MVRGSQKTRQDPLEPDAGSFRSEGNSVGTLLTLFRVGLISILVVAIVLFVIGVVFLLTLGLTSFILFKVAPIVLVGWIVLKIFNRRRSRDHLSEADRAWLENRK